MKTAASSSITDKGPISHQSKEIKTLLNKSLLENYANNFFNDTREKTMNENLSHRQINGIIHECSQANPEDRPLLNLLTWNVRCLTQMKLNAIQHYLDEWTKSASVNGKKQYNCLGESKNHFVDIIGITETWLQHDTKFQMFNIKNYNSTQVSRKSGKKGGGLLLFVHKSYQTVIIDSDCNDDIEFVLLKVITKTNDYFILLTYRPNGNVETFIDTLERLVLKTNRDKLIIMGDMNLNVRKESDNSVKMYLDTLTSLNLSVLNSASTRNSLFGGDDTVIDHAIASSSLNVLPLTSNRIQLISDHNFLLLISQLETFGAKSKTVIKKKTLNYDALASQLQYNLSGKESCFDDCNSYFNALHDSLLQSIDECTTNVNIKLPSFVKSLPTWADQRYKNMLSTLHNLEEKINKRKIMSLPRNELVDKYNELSNLCEQYASIKAKIYYRKLQVKNIRHAWSIINELTGKVKRNKVMIVKNENDECESDLTEIANTFQRKFLSYSRTPPQPIDGHKYVGKLMQKTFCFEEITPELITHHIALLNEKKACGYDNIDAKVLKCCMLELAPHLANIFNLIINTGCYPERLKQSVIIPVHKGGDVLDCGNYRPISLLPQLDKIYEAILYNQLSKYLEIRNVLDPLQYGFRQGRGCNEAVAMMINTISKVLETGSSTLVISLDISKAFDSVDHRILMRKLNFLGIRGLSYDVLYSFLLNRRQVVKIDTSLSIPESVDLGVPQGSNLGPLLFNLMINDISEINIKSKLLKYADDIIMILPLEKNNPILNANSLQSDIDTIMEYYQMNLLKVNLTKSKCILVGNNTHEELDIILDGNSIIKCKELTYLGCVIDDELKFTSHVDKISKSMGSAINALRYLSTMLSVDALIQFYHAHIQSHVIYAGFMLMHCRSIDIERLQRLQKKALKIIYGLPDTYSTTDLFKKEAKKILPIAGLIYNSTILMVKKCLKSKDGSLPSIARLKSQRRKDLVIASAKKKALKDDIIHAGCKLYNNLPTEIKNENNFYLFKNDVKKFLLSRNESLAKSGQFSARNFFI